MAAAIIPDCSVRAMFNNTGSTIPAHRAVKFSAAGDPPRGALPTAVDDAILGITVNDIEDQRIGDVQVEGRAVIEVGTGGVSAGNRLMPEANTGKAIAFSVAGGTNASLLGQTHVTAAAAALIEVNLPGPFVSRQG